MMMEGKKWKGRKGLFVGRSFADLIGDDGLFD